MIIIVSWRGNDREGCAFNCSFSIDKDTDPDGKFSVNSYGLITTAKTLDRETQREHRIHVLATDKGKRALGKFNVYR